MMYPAEEIEFLLNERDRYREALAQAVAEIETSPYQSQPWGFGIAFRLNDWKRLLDAGPKAGGDV